MFDAFTDTVSTLDAGKGGDQHEEGPTGFRGSGLLEAFAVIKCGLVPASEKYDSVGNPPSVHCVLFSPAGAQANVFASITKR